MFIVFSNSVANSAQIQNLKIFCEGKEDGQILEVFQGHVIRLEDGGAEAEYYRVTELQDSGLKGELAFTGLRTNDQTAVTSPQKTKKTIELRQTKSKSWDVTTKEVATEANKKKPYVFTFHCQEK